MPRHCGSEVAPDIGRTPYLGGRAPPRSRSEVPTSGGFRPVERPSAPRGLLERRVEPLPKGESGRSRAVRPQVPDPLLGVLRRGPLAGPDPPARDVRLWHEEEPVAPAAQD